MKFILLATLLVAIMPTSSCRKKLCSSCSRSIEQIKKEKMQLLLKEILDKLDLPIMPNITRNNIPRIPPVLKALQAKTLEPNTATTDMEEDHYHSKTQRIIIFPDKEHAMHEKAPTKSYFFSLTGKAADPSLRIYKSKLKVYVKLKANATKKNHKGTINIYRRDFPITQGIPRKVLIATRNIKRGKHSSWYVFKLRSLTRQWKRQPHRNLGIDIVISHDSYQIVQGKDSEFQPYLEVFVKNKKVRRRKRTAGLECGRGSREKRCCRYPLVVDFEKIGGWDFVLAPRKFGAYVCSGDCHDSTLTQHLHGALVRKATGQVSTCCAPNKFGEINFIYLNAKQEVVFGELQSVVALSCGCV